MTMSKGFAVYRVSVPKRFVTAAPAGNYSWGRKVCYSLPLSIPSRVSGLPAEPQIANLGKFTPRRRRLLRSVSNITVRGPEAGKQMARALFEWLACGCPLYRDSCHYGDRRTSRVCRVGLGGGGRRGEAGQSIVWQLSTQKVLPSTLVCS